jgi:hypothetical protein
LISQVSKCLRSHLTHLLVVFDEEYTFVSEGREIDERLRILSAIS